MGVVAEIFLLKALEDILHQWWKLEIKPNRVSLRWNFYADMQLIRGRFWLLLWMVKKFSKYLENTLLRCGKILKWVRRLQRHGWARLIGSGIRALLRVSVYSLSIA